MKSLSFRKDLVGVQEELLRFAYKLTTDREEANDLLQETSLKALDNEDKYTPDTNFKGWMYTIMRNIFINNYRKVVRDLGNWFGVCRSSSGISSQAKCQSEHGKSRRFF